MRFDVLTLFPEAFTSFTNPSIIGRAVMQKLLDIKVHDIRDFAANKHRRVDDVPYGGGAGMVMSCQPLFDAINHVKGLVEDQAPVIFFTPHGQTWQQTLAEKYATQKRHRRFILLCGHYEGIDQRIRDHLVDTEISLGPYILTGGELPAQIFMDSVSRLLPGVIGKEASHQEESFSQHIGRETVEYPHYTRPETFNGWEVPEVLLSGHHANIENWRKAQCGQRGPSLGGERSAPKRGEEE